MPGVRRQRRVQHGVELRGDRRVLHAHQRLHPAVEVAVHEVGAAEPVLAPIALAEDHDAGVLEEAAHDAADVHVLRQARHSGA